MRVRTPFIRIHSTAATAIAVQSITRIGVRTLPLWRCNSHCRGLALLARNSVVGSSNTSSTGPLQYSRGNTSTGSSGSDSTSTASININIGIKSLNSAINSSSNSSNSRVGSRQARSAHIHTDTASTLPSPVTRSSTLAEHHGTSRPRSPTLRDKIQSRAGAIAGHLNHGQQHHYSTATKSNSTSSSPFSNSASLPHSESQSQSQSQSSADKSRKMGYSVRKIGAPNTLEHRVFIEEDGKPISPFHDIPLYANAEQTILNMIVEVPRWTNAKMEISKEETLNPIKQDIKKGKLRFVRNCFPHKGYLWNYGAFPQTWEDPNVVHPETKAKGDNDPLDVCEIGELVARPGDIKQVKVLGVMALLDEEETDWKIIVIDVKDPLANRLNDVEDVERHLPGLLRATNEWFRIYKIPDGKPENQFAFSGECKNKKYAMDIVRECAEAWERLITGKTNRGELSLVNTTVSKSPDRTDPSSLNIPRGEDKLPAPIDPSIDKWFFISGAPQ